MKTPEMCSVPCEDERCRFSLYNTGRSMNQISFCLRVALYSRRAGRFLGKEEGLGWLLRRLGFFVVSCYRLETVLRCLLWGIMFRFGAFSMYVA